MGFEVLVFSNAFDKTILEDYKYTQGNNLCIILCKTISDAHNLIQEFTNKGIEAISYSEYENICNQECNEYSKLEEMTYKELIDNQFEKNEEFIVFNNNNVSLWKIENEDVEYINDSKLRGNVKFSNTGIFMVNWYKNKISLYATQKNLLFNDFYFEDKIEDVIFNMNDTLFAVELCNKIYFVDTYRGKILLDTQKESFVWDAEICKVHMVDSKRIIDLRDIKEIKSDDNLKILKMHKDQAVYFYKKAVSKIQYYNREYEISKTHVNIEDIQFKQSSNYTFAYITKKVKEKYMFYIEVYHKDHISIINLETKLVDFKVSDKMILTLDILNNIAFYIRDKNTFRVVKTISKEPGVIISLSRTVALIYDELTECLEFYDSGISRCIYTQRECSQIEWSKSGLYVAAISERSGLVQLFNNNGKLIYKKVFNMFNTLKWRPFIYLSEEVKSRLRVKDLSEYIKKLSISNNTEYDLETKIADWRNFLINKKRLFQ